MAQHIIYYLDRIFIITDEQFGNKLSNEQLMLPEDILKIANDFETNIKKKYYYFYTRDVENVWKEFQRNFKIIEAAGGVVKNDEGDILAIFRLGKWDLPKGKIEDGEKPEEAALREISEECGINGHKLLHKICDTYHTYSINGKKILKKTFWFNFSISGVPKLTPLTIENIEKACWIKPDKFNEKLENSYPSIRQVMREFDNLLNSNF
ncbi:MAG: hypothetical protein COX07_00490 [Bacteroidetes bacterium CG23_combo_of_CG06-09_8_20_14_all_32_9]|nr:MAG: hypothetical protein COX07_00490 [Bacteroidetes bacterium CG23_combo_of_CG06-09_8_20_14_all_32_9]